MSERSPATKLEEALEKTEEHHKMGNKRIRAYYDPSYEPSEEFTDLEKAPHDSIMNEGLELINLGHDTMSTENTAIGDREIDAGLILYGVGMERLLTGAHLKLNSEDFVQHLENTERTPSFREARDVVVPDFDEKVGEEEDAVKILRLFLNLIREHRNNEVHLGYHQHIHGDLAPAILGVAYTLGYLYIDEKSDVWDRIGSKLSNYPNYSPDDFGPSDIAENS